LALLAPKPIATISLVVVCCLFDDCVTDPSENRRSAWRKCGARVQATHPP
jgi:hypothetical protein